MRRTPRDPAPTVVVTGASSGLGRGTAEAFGRRGADVVLVARDGAALAEVAAGIEQSGGRALVAVADVAVPGALERVADDAVSAFGRIDVWINNASVLAVGPFWDVPLADHERVLAVNAGGMLAGAHAAITRFRRQGDGVLLNVGSLEGDVPIAYHSSYAASKAAVDTFTRVLAQELRLAGLHDRIRVGSILPWALDTPLWQRVSNHLGRAPRMARMESPDRVVRAIVAAAERPRLSQPVGVKASASGIGRRLAPHTMDRIAAVISEQQRRRASHTDTTDGALHRPMHLPSAVHGTTRARMRREDAAADLPPAP
ncbi:SDR family NAD(P)-dependent oxidoreductase [Microbacterium sp. 179-B 1A2 NHS]|uniref:SDR family NAD(P)-dependent oxidoreductase n=1 Tax=Microbacterium sp. 179-B 1A2 NHS TaxID=3142383 RepID=UPI0039A0D491